MQKHRLPGVARQAQQKLVLQWETSHHGQRYTQASARCWAHTAHVVTNSDLFHIKGAVCTGAFLDRKTCQRIPWAGFFNIRPLIVFFTGENGVPGYWLLAAHLLFACVHGK